MNTDRDTIIETGCNVINNEIETLQNLVNYINDDFAKAAELIYGSKGRVIISGMGKSGLIARKIVATMNSTGTPAIFLHPSDAFHGDLGIVCKEDIVILISNSGNTIEVLNLIPFLKKISVKIIGIVGNVNSKLAEVSDIVLNLDVKEEACPYNLAPTSSTTATLALGDALSIALLKMRNFTPDDFAFLHPGGSLGKRLSLFVKEVMKTGDNVPKVNLKSNFKDVVYKISAGRLGVTCVIDDNGKLKGIITDGDIRRTFEKDLDINCINAGMIMTFNPKTIKESILASFALHLMEKHKITSLVVTDEDSTPIGIVHMHDLIELGLDNK